MALRPHTTRVPFVCWPDSLLFIFPLRPGLSGSEACTYPRSATACPAGHTLMVHSWEFKRFPLFHLLNTINPQPLWLGCCYRGAARLGDLPLHNSLLSLGQNSVSVLREPGDDDTSQCSMITPQPLCWWGSDSTHSSAPCEGDTAW